MFALLQQYPEAMEGEQMGDDLFLPINGREPIAGMHRPPRKPIGLAILKEGGQETGTLNKLGLRRRRGPRS